MNVIINLCPYLNDGIEKGIQLACGGFNKIIGRPENNPRSSTVRTTYVDDTWPKHR